MNIFLENKGGKVSMNHYVFTKHRQFITFVKPEPNEWTLVAKSELCNAISEGISYIIDIFPGS